MMKLGRFPTDNVVHPHGLRRENASYIVMWVLFYAWVIAFATWWTASPVMDSAFDMQIRSVMHAGNLLSSAVFVFVIRRKWFVNAARAGAVVIVVSMVAFYLAPSAPIKILTAVTGSIAIGCVNICILIPMVFALNNTEKLYAIVTSNILIQVISLVNEGSAAAKPVLFLTLLLCSLGAVLFFKKGFYGAPGGGEPAVKPVMHRRVYLSLLFNCVIAVLCRGVGKGILNNAAVSVGASILIWYYIGGLAGWLGNITFSSVAVGLLCHAFILQVPQLSILFAVLLGLGNMIGMINMYFIIGVIGKKYDSMRYIRMSVLFIGICGGVSGIVIGNLISRVGTYEISISFSILSAVVMMAFMFVSPIMERAEYVNDWGFDSCHTEVGGGRAALFKPYALSKREAEVCDLLLQGYTLRQISVILPISYSTVNTYCTAVYRKLGINSRTELLLMFKDRITE
jgi:DNA-binding CsgD family transcriptional regulator